MIIYYEVSREEVDNFIVMMKEFTVQWCVSQKCDNGSNGFLMWLYGVKCCSYEYIMRFKLKDTYFKLISVFMIFMHYAMLSTRGCTNHAFIYLYSYL